MHKQKLTQNYILNKFWNIYYSLLLDPHIYYKVNKLKFYLLLIYIIILIFYNKDIIMSIEILKTLIEYYSINNEFITIDNFSNINGDESSSEVPNNLGVSTPERGPTPDPEGSPMSITHPSDRDDEDSSEVPNNLGVSTPERGATSDPEGSPMSLIQPNDIDYSSSSSESTTDNLNLENIPEEELIDRVDQEVLYDEIEDLNINSRRLLDEANRVEESGNRISEDLRFEIDSHIYSCIDASTNVNRSEWNADNYPRIDNNLVDELSAIIWPTSDQDITSTNDEVITQTNDEVITQTNDEVITQTNDEVITETNDEVITETNDENISSTKD